MQWDYPCMCKTCWSETIIFKFCSRLNCSIQIEREISSLVMYYYSCRQRHRLYMRDDHLRDIQNYYIFININVYKYCYSTRKFTKKKRTTLVTVLVDTNDKCNLNLPQNLWTCHTCRSLKHK